MIKPKNVFFLLFPTTQNPKIHEMTRRHSEQSPLRRSWNNYGGVQIIHSFNDIDTEQRLKINLAGLYLYLAVYPHSRILTKISTLEAAQRYRDYYSYTSMFWLWLAILTLLFLSFVEDGELRWPVETVLPTEFACLVVLTIMVWQKIAFMGWEPFCKNTSSKLHVSLLLVLGIDFACATVSFAVVGKVAYYRYLRVLRPFVIFDHASSVRLRFIDMMVSGYRARTMFSLMSFNLVFFSVVGTILFYETAEGAEYFPDFTTSLVTLIVLQTTSNHPAVIVKAFSEYSRWSELYFVFFLLMSHFLMLNLMLGVIYHELTARLRTAAANELLDSASAMRISMSILRSCREEEEEEHNTSNDTMEQANVDYELTVYMIATEFSLSKPHVRRLLERCRMSHDRGNATDQGISLQMFARIPAMLRLQRSIETEDEDDGLYGGDESPMLPKLRRLLSKRIPNYPELTYVDTFVVLSLLCLLVIMVIAMVVDLPSYFQDTSTWLDIIGQALTLCFIVELLLKLVAFGLFRFSDDMWNVFDTLCVSLSFVGAFIAEDNKSQQIMSGARLMRLLRVVPGFRNITGAAAAFAPAVGPSVCAILCIFYSTAILAVGVLGEFRLHRYAANDFRDFVAALVTLFELAIVNDWNETMASFVESTGTKWVQLFFVAWWALSQLILFNSVTSLVLDGFEVRMRELNAVNDAPRTLPLSSSSSAVLNQDANNSSSGDSIHGGTAMTATAKLEKLELFRKLSFSPKPTMRRRLLEPSPLALDDAEEAREEEDEEEEEDTRTQRRPVTPFVKSSSFTVGRMFVELFRNVDEPTEEEVNRACLEHGFRI